MSALAETVSKEICAPIARAVTVEMPPRSAMDRPLDDIIHGRHFGTFRERLGHSQFPVAELYHVDVSARALAATSDSSARHFAIYQMGHYDIDTLAGSYPGRSLLTCFRDDVFVTTHLTDPMTPTPELLPREQHANPGLVRALGRLNYLRSLPDGWLGEDSLGASEFAGSEAEALLKRISREVPDAPLPALGLDTDGTIVMSWSSNGLIGSLTVYGDETYSYFVRRQSDIARDPEASIAEPLGKDLTRILAA